MNLWMQIMVINMLGIITIACGNNTGKRNNPINTTINSAGQNVAEDGRIVLSSQSEDNQLVIPAGACENCIVNKRKIEEAIARTFNDISKVSHLSFSETNALNFLVDFNVSFTVETTSGAVYEGIQCEVWTYDTHMNIRSCSNDQVILSEDKRVSIQYKDIMIVDSRRVDPRSILE